MKPTRNPASVNSRGRNNSYKVIYLTGAPATGKTTLTRSLMRLTENIRVFSYGEELTKYLASKKGYEGLKQIELRDKSAKVVTRKDVSAVDKQLFRYVKKMRKRFHVIIDSHAVTKESFGYRVTPFKLADLRKLAPSVIVVIYTDAQTVRTRIKESANGRPMVSSFEADLHTHLQSTVAIIYAMELAIPIYFFDSNRASEALAKDLAERARLSS